MESVGEELEVIRSTVWPTMNLRKYLEAVSKDIFY